MEYSRGLLYIRGALGSGIAEGASVLVGAIVLVGALVRVGSVVGGRAGFAWVGVSIWPTMAVVVDGTCGAAGAQDVMARLMNKIRSSVEKICLVFKVVYFVIFDRIDSIVVDGVRWIVSCPPTLF
jgi:hypothetical protein